VAKVKVVNTNLDQNLNGTNFLNTASETIFQFGEFTVTSNFEGRKYIDYTNVLSTFVRPVTLETIGVNTTQSDVAFKYDNYAVLNLNKSDLNTYVRFGSAYEYLKISIQNIILKYPASIYTYSNIVKGGNMTFYDFKYDKLTDIATFKTPSSYIINSFGLAFNQGNYSKPDDYEIKNINLSYDKYVVWSALNPNNSYQVIGFTGDTTGVPYILVKTQGNPFPLNENNLIGYINYHIRPNNIVFEEFRTILNSYEQYIVSSRKGNEGFEFLLDDPTLLDDGSIVYAKTSILWPTSDDYNIDISSSAYDNFLNIVLTIGSKYDSVKTDLVARFLTPTSLKTYDLTEDGKMTKLLRTYGWEFDQVRTFVDSLVYINTVTYDKINNIPDQLVSNLARTFGWDYFTLVNEAELVDSFFLTQNNERNLNTDLLPAEINIELWRRILINTNYFWKSKGTREAIKSMFLLIGIPEPFINITEYVYTVDGRIDPREAVFIASDYPTNSLPYDNEGYPKAPLEANSFYFQIAGDADSGQEYMNVFRKAGFDLNQTVDNKKSWIQTGSTTRIHASTPQYYQEDSKLVLNTKEVDVALDTAQGIEYDVYDYMKIDYSANSSGYILPYAYVNISLGYTGSQNTFTLPSQFNKAEGDLEVRYNGILLNAPKEYSGGTGGTYVETTQADYIISGNSFVLTNSNYAINVNNRRDVVEATYLYSGATTTPITGVTVKYMVSRIKPNLVGTSIPLPSAANGDVQVTINGIALTKGTGQFIADYIVDPNNSSQIVVQNPELIAYMNENPFVQVAYVIVTGNTSIAARSEMVRVDSFNTSKIYFNNSANKYVYRLNYMIGSTSEVKILVDGIALEPQTDYSVNINNRYEIFLPKGIKYGSIITAYYLVAGDSYFNPIISNDFGVGDISNMSFLEFIEFIQRRLINATNRKTITDFKGGWYPTLLSVYIQYLKRGKLPYDNPLHSNGYTFENLYPFLSKYNAFFQRFVDQLLSATIILKKGGLLVRNSVFTRQKFTYKRGVYMGNIKTLSNGNATTYSYDKQLSYFGDDGSTFLKRPLFQEAEWNDDSVCVGDLCSNFLVNNVLISYPITTTTTTAYPFNAILSFVEINSFSQYINNGTSEGRYGNITYNIETSPSIIPNYTAIIDLTFLSKLTISGGSGNQVLSIITVNKNGNQEYSVTNTNTGNTTNNFTVSISNGDIVQVILENQALEIIGYSGIVKSETDVTIQTPIVVTPNGMIPSIILPPPHIITT
jgi:hypothetical protein